MITQVPLEDQLRTNPGLDKQAIAELKEWNLEQNHLPKMSEADLAVFYVTNSYDVEATKSHINNYFLMRHYMPEYFVSKKDLHSTEIEEVFDTVFIVSLPKRTKDNYKVILARLLDNDPSKYNFANAVKVMNMVIDSGVYEDGPNNKYVLVFDLNGASMDHRNALSWMGLKKFFDYIRKGSPVRWMGAHYVNTGTGGNDFQDFVKSRIAKGGFVDNSMVHFHSNIDALLDAAEMERSILPKEMGGEAGSALELQKQQTKKLESLHSFFIDLESKVKLAKTQNIPSVLEIFGPEKSF